MTMSQLDATQVLKSAFDSVTGALKTNVVQSVSNVVDLDSISSVFIDGTDVEGSSGSFFEIVASLASEVKRIQIFDTTGLFIGLYVGSIGNETLEFIAGPGTDQPVDVTIPINSRISLRSMEASGPSSGNIAINFLG